MASTLQARAPAGLLRRSKVAVAQPCMSGAVLRAVPLRAHAGGSVTSTRIQKHRTQQQRSGRCRRVEAASSAAESAPSNPPANAAAARKLRIRTIEYNGQKAYFLAPKGDAKGVVLFLHGFAQSPKAYALVYEQLVDQGLLVVAPDPTPMFSISQEELQTAITDSAAFWQNVLWSNTFPPVKLPGTVCTNMGLLGHSVGAGVATFVAAEAAKVQRPYKAVMYMAPQTQVYKTFLPGPAVDAWKNGPDPKTTQFALQYGFADLIAPFTLATQLDEQLQALNQVTPVDSYILGTHVGFEDQLFIGDADVDEELLPRASLVLLVLTLAIALGLRGVNVLPIINFLTARTRAKQRQDGDSKGLTKQQWQPMTAEEVLNASPRSSTTTEAGGVKELTAGKVDDGQGLSAGEKALLLLQMALAGDEFEAKQRPLQASAQPVEGEEVVSILPPEEAWMRYLTLLLAPCVGVWIVAAVASNLTEGGWHWLFWLLALVFGLFSVGGTVALGVQVYVDKWQRPPARVKAAQYFKKVLTQV